MSDLKEFVRKNILELIPYSSARDEFTGTDAILMDANENPYNNPFNRYPDPRQRELRSRLGDMLGLDPDRVFAGNGSDEAIDLLIRIFCNPGNDRIVIMDPSYGMYKVCADVNDVGTDAVSLEEDFRLNSERILDAVKPATKMVFLCSPNNPSANLLQTSEIRRILDGFSGVVVVDEAYIDFAGGGGLLPLLKQYPGLVLLRTLSKAWAAAGIRLGMALADPQVIGLMNRVKYPYNVSFLSQEKALEILDEESRKQEWVEKIVSERKRLSDELATLQHVIKVHPSDANFLLVKVENAGGLYRHLLSGGVVVRDRSRMTHCGGCLRISVGTEKENRRLVELMKSY